MTKRKRKDLDTLLDEIHFSGGDEDIYQCMDELDYNIPALTPLTESRTQSMEQETKVSVKKIQEEIQQGNTTLMGIVEYGLTAEDIEDPILSSKWQQMMDKYVAFTEELQEIEQYLEVNH